MEKKNDKARVGLICSILGLLGPLAIVGIIFSILGLKESKNLDGKGKTQSIIGIIIGSFFLIIMVVAVAYTGDDTSENTSSNSDATPLVEEKSTTETKETKPEKTEEEKKNEFISKCQQYSYEEIARNPDNYNGKKATFTGEVIQVQEGFMNRVVLRVNVTKQEYEYIDTVTWKDTIYVEYKYKDGESKILNDDIITLYGTLKGSKTYTTVLGSSLTIPKMTAKYIILNK